MVKVNGEEIKWEKAPNFVNNVQRKILWRNEATGATFAILQAPKGLYLEQSPHSHPNSNQFTFRLSGEFILPDGTIITVSEDNYGFDYCPKGKMHGGHSGGLEVLKDYIYLHYWDGPDDWNSKEAGQADSIMSRAAVIHWVETMFKSMGEGDFDAFCNLCSDDVNLYPPDSRPLYGIEAMKKLTKPWFENYNMSHEITKINAKVDQNLAYAFSEYVDTISPKRGGKDTVTPNKAIYILRRGQGNMWKATDIMWNRNPRE